MASGGTDRVNDDPSPGYVYLIEGPGGLFKIGRSINPLTRLAQIAPKANGLELITHIATDDCVWLERYLHGSFSHRRVKGEWFYLSVADVRLFKSIQFDVSDIDDLPSELVAQWVLNEAKGFEWGERNDSAILPVAERDPRLVFHIDQELLDALERHINKSRIDLKMSAVLRLAVRQYLETVGEWPPPQT